MKVVHFGAGNIGRGFIGLLFIENGCEVTFIDVDETKINLLNRYTQYPVVVVGEYEKVINAEGYRGILANNTDEVVRAITEADILTTAVGKEALHFVAPLIARGLAQKLTSSKASSKPLHIIVVACENVNDNTSYLKSLVLPYLTTEQIQEMETIADFPNCVVDRIVPNVSHTTQNHPLVVAVEEYAQFVVDKTALRSKELHMNGITLTDNIQSVLEQKLFTLNMAHAIAGYYGYIAGFQYVHEAMRDDRVQTLLRGAIAEVGKLLQVRHNISEADHAAYAAKTFQRLSNPKLSDEIVRVARQPKRKLHPSDRLVAPAQRALAAGIVPAYLATGIAGALAYDYASDTQAIELVSDLRQKGIDLVLKEVTGLNPSDTLAQLVKSDFAFQALTRKT